MYFSFKNKMTFCLILRHLLKNSIKDLFCHLKIQPGLVTVTTYEKNNNRRILYTLVLKICSTLRQQNEKKFMVMS